MTNLEILQSIDLGNSVAEFDEALENYFIETDIFRKIQQDDVDIIAGDKGTGKTALFRILQRRYTEIEELDNVEVLPAINLEGSPIFNRLNEDSPLDEGQYITLWKAYFLSLAGNWLLEFYDGEWTETMSELDELLVSTGLRSADESPATVFSSVMNLFRRLLNPTTIEAAVTITPNGMPIILPRVEFGTVEPSEPSIVPHEVAFSLLNRALNESELKLWLAMDRLDEAFAGMPAAEIPSLRALFRTYLDLVPYECVRLKLFVRNDLFRRIIQGGFVNLTHVNARKVQIVWDDEALEHLLFLRLRENTKLITALGVDREAREQIIRSVFPEQVDQGDRKPVTFRWMMGRIRDGNDVRPPRNLIDLVKHSLNEAIRRQERNPTDYVEGVPLIPSESLKRGLSILSKARVEDTLLAEAGAQAAFIERFRGSKATHNYSSLAVSLRLNGDELEKVVRFLKEIGFLESSGSLFKIPMLYRDGLGIKQGKAFVEGEDGDDDDDDE